MWCKSGVWGYVAPKHVRFLIIVVIILKTYSGPDATQHFAGRVGNLLDIANMVLFLASDKAGFISGENICIDGGMTKQMIYHNDFGWKLEKKKNESTP